MEIDVMLCDHAQVEGGKLFVSGANIDRMMFQSAQPPFVVNFATAGLVRVPWQATNAEHVLHFQLVTEDGGTPPLPPGPEGETPSEIGGEMHFNVGRPPQVASGDDQMVPFAFNFQGLPLMSVGRYVIRFLLDGTEVRSVTFTVAHQAPQGFQGASFPR